MFYIGQKVVCVDSGRVKLPPVSGKTSIQAPLVEGKTYTIKDVGKDCCNSVVDVGLKSDVLLSRCASCGRFYRQPKYWVLARRFVPLEDYEAMQELVNELTKPELIPSL